MLRDKPCAPQKIPDPILMLFNLLHWIVKEIRLRNLVRTVAETLNKPCMLT